VLWVTDPNVPFRVNVCVPVPALWATVIVAVDWTGFDPSSVRVDGEIEQVVPPGKPEQVRDTLPVRPPSV